MKVTYSNPVGRGTAKLKTYAHASRTQTDDEIGLSIAFPRRVIIDPKSATELWNSAAAQLAAEKEQP